jgi:broad specificity phosphatase PhoE
MVALIGGTPPLISLSQFERMVAEYDATELSGEGTEAVEELARQLPEALILSSDLPRTQETAQIIAGNGSSIKFSPLFRELKSPCIAIGLLNKL